MTKLAYVSILFLVCAASTHAQSVLYNFDNRADFSKFKTYRWVSIEHAEHVDPATENQITTALDAELTKKGLTKAGADIPDLHIGYQTAISTETQYRIYREDYEYGADWQDGWQGRMVSKQPSASTHTIYVGQLALDMYDRSRKKIVWRAVMSKTLDPKASTAERKTRIAKAASMLLDNYPPKNKLRF
jgi:Domain of unknown function (DUF4136)